VREACLICQASFFGEEGTWCTIRLGSLLTMANSPVAI
jgi:hypothetical protein